MDIDASGVIGAIVVLPMLLWTAWLFARPHVFSGIQLPRLAREHGWRLRGRGPAPRDLPGDGTQSWETPLPDTAVEFLGRYRGRPVHGVQLTVRKGTQLQPASGQRGPRYVSYTVLSMALHGDSTTRYQDFADWARNRKVETGGNVRQEGMGMRSISWRGRMTRKRLLSALDELTGG